MLLSKLGMSVLTAICHNVCAPFNLLSSVDTPCVFVQHSETHLCFGRLTYPWPQKSVQSQRIEESKLELRLWSGSHHSLLNLCTRSSAWRPGSASLTALQVLVNVSGWIKFTQVSRLSRWWQGIRKCYKMCPNTSSCSQHHLENTHSLQCSEGNVVMCCSNSDII